MTLTEAAELVGLKRKAQVFQSMDLPRGTNGMYQGVIDGHHMVLISPDEIEFTAMMQGKHFEEQLSETIFHELTHALQLERDYDGDWYKMNKDVGKKLSSRMGVKDVDEFFRKIQTDREAFKVYWDAPWEVEARANGAKYAHHVVTPDLDEG